MLLMPNYIEIISRCPGSDADEDQVSLNFQGASKYKIRRWRNTVSRVVDIQVRQCI
jgi:hypothetical protein